MKLLAEYRHFISCPRDMRVLLTANMVYAFVLPVLNVFVGAYVLRKSDDVALLIAYQLISYVAIPLVFLFNGWLLQHLPVKRLYAVGMLLGGVAMAVLVSLGELNFAKIALVGILMSMATGICWANRGFLTLATTADGNRNYFYAVENAFLTITSVLVPLAAGWLIEGATTRHWFGGLRDHAYYPLAAAVVMLTVAASAIIQTGRFPNPPRSRFVFFRFHPLWHRFQILAVLRGLVQGYILTAPAMLVMHVAGGTEGALGMAQAVGGLIAAVMLYAIGRFSAPQHRVFILAGGLSLFAIGSLFNAVLFNPLGVWLFMLCLLMAIPLLDLAYFPIQMRVIDIVSAIEHRNPFAYIVHHEFALLVGRIFGCGLFLILAMCVSRPFALRYALLTVGLVQLFSIVVARSVAEGCIALDKRGSEADLRSQSPYDLTFAG